MVYNPEYLKAVMARRARTRTFTARARNRSRQNLVLVRVYEVKSSDFRILEGTRRERLCEKLNRKGRKEFAKTAKC